MQLTEVLDPGRIRLGAQVRSKKGVIEALAELFASVDALIAREKLGSTGLGHGVAIPHGRVRGAREALAAVLVNEQAIDFDAVDSEPVDVFVALLVPEDANETHLNLLAELAGRLDDADLRAALRAASTCERAHALLGGGSDP
jgi:PTS system nitrogen regulatory IIA component